MAEPQARPDPGSGRGRTPAVASVMASVMACLLLWAVLVAPEQLGDSSWSAFVRLPLEGLVLVALALVLPRRAARITVAVGGLLLGLLTIVRLLDLGFFFAFDRPFDPISDPSSIGSGVALLSDSIGRPGAVASLVAGGLAGIVLIAAVTLSALRVTRLLDRRRSVSVRALLVVSLAWTLGALAGAPIASTSAADLALTHVSQVRHAIRDRRAFTEAFAQDAFGDTPGGELLTGLRGRDVLFVFVESYGRVAVQGSAVSEQVDAALRAHTGALRKAGFSSRSAFLTSPTFGGISWLAHSTLQSGLWVDSQQRYDHLMTSNRLTLSGAFKRAGWRTVGDVPSNRKDWPEGWTFYHYDRIYDSRNVGYAGPKFGYAAVPDQYTLAAFQRLELTRRDRPPVMAEIDLVSSHTPWAPLPELVDWASIGDGSAFEDILARGRSPEAVWREPGQVRAAYGQSVVYSLAALVSFVQRLDDKDLVLILLGDHQPAAIVSGHQAGHDVPVTMIAHDPAVIRRIADWGWQDGMRPAPDAPVWRMDTFRDRFLTAFGPRSADPRSEPRTRPSRGLG